MVSEKRKLRKSWQLSRNLAEKSKLNIGIKKYKEHDEYQIFLLQGGIQKFQDFIKKTKNWFSFANLLVAFEIVPFALNTTIKKIIECLFLGHPLVWR